MTSSAARTARICRCGGRWPARLGARCSTSARALVVSRSTWPPVVWRWSHSTLTRRCWRRSRTAPRGSPSRASSPTRAGSRWGAASRWCSCRCRRCSCSEGRVGARRSCAARWITSSPAGCWPRRWPTRSTASTRSATRRRRPRSASSVACATPASWSRLRTRAVVQPSTGCREIVGPGERYESQDIVVRLDRVSAHEVAAEGSAVGFLNEPDRLVPQTEEYLGSTVVVLRAP